MMMISRCFGIDKKRRAGRTCSNEMTELIRAPAYGDAKSFRLFQAANHARVRRRWKVTDSTDFTDAGPAGRCCFARGRIGRWQFCPFRDAGLT
jgi:hypothetical protein